MALVKLGAIITDIRGKVAGQYFTKNKNSIGLNNTPLSKSDPKKKAKKANPKQSSSMILSAVAGGWRGLNDDQRLEWITYAGTLTFKNKLNMDYTPSGYEVYCKRNMQMINLSIPGINSPSTAVTVADVSKFTIDIDSSNNIIVEYNLPASPADSIWALFASYVQSPGLAVPKSGLKMIINSSTFPTTPLDVTSEYTLVFGQQPIGGRVFFRVDVYSTDSGIQNGSKLTKADAGFV